MSSFPLAPGETDSGPWGAGLRKGCLLPRTLGNGVGGLGIVRGSLTRPSDSTFQEGQLLIWPFCSLGDQGFLPQLSRQYPLLHLCLFLAEVHNYQSQMSEELNDTSGKSGKWETSLLPALNSSFQRLLLIVHQAEGLSLSNLYTYSCPSPHVTGFLCIPGSSRISWGADWSGRSPCRGDP